ncbi:hypothetical protein [Kamptonema sp. UHCC 0994]|uniref:hypothetical protein n=1 Tax=Kamptonema sp. UHCC 0994 TaxID=3031329 RepID=UPI0023B99DA7|nr:hypothetical protein [Kamptonema sp. UHCC 0994]MDF0555328.1 hypothetical protein [Kamptonema sp. UHCC 0994]
MLFVVGGVSRWYDVRSRSIDDRCSVPDNSLTQPAGTAKGRHQYFRFSWRDRTGVNHQHIPGGNSTNPIAYSRAAQLREAIARIS